MTAIAPNQIILASNIPKRDSQAIPNMASS